MIGDLTKAVEDFKRACLLDYDDQTHQLQVEIQNNLSEMNEKRNNYNNNNNNFDDNINDGIIYIILYLLYIVSLTQILSDSIISEALVDMEVNTKFRYVYNYYYLQ